MEQRRYHLQVMHRSMKGETQTGEEV